MSGPQFFETRAGRTYYEVTLPNLTRQISRLADLLALLVEIEEKKQAKKQNGCCSDCTKEN